MASHVPFLAVRPNDQFSTDVKTRDFASSNGVLTSDSAMDAPEAPMIPVSSIHAPKLPSPIRFTLVTILSLTISVFLYSLIADAAGYELASVSRNLTGEWQVAAVLGWKLVTLGFAWTSGYNWLDLTSLTLLSNIPYYYLLNTFYLLSPASVLSALAIDLVSIAVPFGFFCRTPSSADSKLLKASSRAVVHDWSVLALVTGFGAAIYAVTVYTSFFTWLPVHMVIHFDQIPSVGVVRDANLILLAALAIPAGFASTRFVFVPAVLASNSLLSALDPITEPAKFDSETSSFSQTVAYNLGLGAKGFSYRTQVITKRTTVLIISSFMNTLVRVFGTIEGTELVGVAGWAGLWAAAGAFTGIAYSWVADE